MATSVARKVPRPPPTRGKSASAATATSDNRYRDVMRAPPLVPRAGHGDEQSARLPSMRIPQKAKTLEAAESRRQAPGHRAESPAAFPKKIPFPQRPPR